ncbi:MAG: tRNA preQ1(34) S-adenosylmethionine ribosyltransferase-isomerase QueA [Bacteroidales bacterium]|jgi:S-adenosylmethionine:tRNA ribosyltransferase-isomerase|nr:tRNA preQ1(34) S-adenosylmethionine ribosyltransferase-isomerase QueA [Bacteroidales bacterium]MDI9574896.1 tRNA preQ1(34) S-adenosylmethionine ribosyltransferase-isomerase QueA [Bacteroidota bacterium]MDD2593896.1 tRNA preQ1(34) S-adenosylmethionine ribosyltransferase-isomerase QueA [Bacteroidales bacterium]MDD3755612.1 tRNA preQ1(34) S-adenosylmethionine ribosyltransferase-isomerase QueA [Bacteroidales bacterium]MDY0400536.1 tRNA preQ1(34) S-adenosylmethionine ribosyltransferase-isomerase 
MKPKKLMHFNFDLPDELIARYPIEERDECRLMVVHKKTGEIEHRIFKDIIEYFDEGDVMIVNNTKVFPSRLMAIKERTGAQIEVILLRELNPELKLWDVTVEPARKIRIGNKLFFGENAELIAEVIDNTTSRGRAIRFLTEMPHDKFLTILKSLGELAVPIILDRPIEPIDNEYFQTVFAKVEGSVLPPFAGLHFTPLLMKRMEVKGINFAEITLHIGTGDLRKIDVQDLARHKTDAEEFIITEEACQIVNEAKKNKRKVCAVGDSVLKAIESSHTIDGFLMPAHRWTSLFIYPPYEFNVPDAYLTNFNLPYSIALMSAATFADYDLIMNAYEIAVKEKYRFHVYGDAMLIID